MFKVNSLLKAIQTLKKINAKQPAIPIIQDYYLINANYIINNNLEIELHAKIETENKDTFLVPKSIEKVLMKLKGTEVLMEVKNETFVLLTDKGTFDFSITDDFEDYPTINKDDFELVGTFETDISSFLPYLSKDEQRPAMTGLFLDSTNFCGTDAHKLRWKAHNQKIDVKHTMIIPAKAVQLTKGKFLLSSSEKHGVINQEDTLIYFRKIDARYPDYKAVIPSDNPIKLTVDKKELTEKLELAKIAANPATNQVVFVVNGECVISSENWTINAYNKKLKQISYYQTTLKEHTHKGDNITIGMNAVFLGIVLKDCAEKLTFNMSVPTRAIVINDDTLLMPVLLKN